MARVLKWKEKLVLAVLTLFFSLARAWPLGTYNGASHDRPTYSRLVTGVNQKTTFGIELMARRPYARLIRASLVPVAMPLAAGAYIAMAGAVGAAAAPPGEGPAAAPDGAAAAAASSCGGGGGTGTVTGTNGCYTVYCTEFAHTSPLSCYTCGRGTCAALCAC
jgi:hypothetical protein